MKRLRRPALNESDYQAKWNAWHENQIARSEVGFWMATKVVMTILFLLFTMAPDWAKSHTDIILDGNFLFLLLFPLVYAGLEP